MVVLVFQNFYKEELEILPILFLSNPENIGGNKQKNTTRDRISVHRAKLGLSKKSIP